MAKKSLIAKQRRTPKFSTRATPDVKFVADLTLIYANLVFVVSVLEI